MVSLIAGLEALGPLAPLAFVVLFLAASFLMIWRLEAMSDQGFEGTVLGTLIMPYCSGIGNLIFAFLIGRDRGPGSEVLINCLVNNVTNLTLLIGLPALIWGMNVTGAGSENPRRSRKRRGKKEIQPEVNRLSLLLTLLAVLFFSGAAWVLALDRQLDFSDGLVLVGLFLFWQCFHVFDVLKKNVSQERALGWRLAVNLALLIIGAWAVYISIDWLVHWISRIKTGRISAQYLGWFSGWLMVLPNAVMALYYAWRGRPEITYSSQVGDGHICIPLCLGIAALYAPIDVPAFFELGILILCGATIVHIVFLAIFGRLPRWLGLALTAAYGFFVYRGFIK